MWIPHILRIHISTDMKQSFHTKQNKCGICFIIMHSMMIPILKTHLFHDMHLSLLLCFIQTVHSNKQTDNSYILISSRLECQTFIMLNNQISTPPQKYLLKVLLYVQNSVLYYLPHFCLNTLNISFRYCIMNFVPEMFWNKLRYYTSSPCFTSKLHSWNSVRRSKMIFPSELRE